MTRYFHLRYIGISILCTVIWLFKREDVELLTLIMWETLIVFGYIASIGDLKKKTIPNQLILCMMGGFGLILTPQLFYATDKAIATLFQGILGFLIAGFVCLFVYWLSRKGLGGGDVKFMAASGLYLGTSGVLPSLFWGSVFAAVAAGILILTKKIKKNDTIPLVPFLYTGMVLTILVY